MTKKEKKKVFDIAYSIQDRLATLRHLEWEIQDMLDELYNLTGDQGLPDWAKTREECS